MKHTPRQSGSAFMIILVAVAMFAALSYAVSRGTRSGVASIADDQAKLAAQEIISYGNTLATSVQKLRLRGCTEAQISAQRSLTPWNGGGYTNGSAPTDFSCHIFQSAGGNVSLVMPDDKNWQAAGTPGTWSIATDNAFATMGDAAKGELYVVYGNIKLGICQKINGLVGIGTAFDAPPTATIATATPFNGTYLAVPTAVSVAALAGKSAFCVKDGTNYKFVQILLAR